MHRSRGTIAGCALLALVSFSSRAHADAASESAEKLFDEAKALLLSGKYDQACPKLEESQRLDPAIGTEFNLADCDEHIGRTASAYAHFIQVAADAKKAGRTEREKSARDRAAGLETRLSRLAIRLADPNASAVTVKRDDVTVSPEDLSRAVPVDPGEHVIVATAPGKIAWRTSTRVANDASKVEVVVPALAAEPTLVVQPPPASPVGSTPADESDRSTGKGQRTLAIVALGVGAVGLGVGTVTGLMSLSKHDAAKNLCTDPHACPTPDGARAWTDATTLGTYSTVGFIVGGVAIAGAAVLWLTAPKANALGPATGWQVAPSVGVGSVGLAARGAF